MRPRSTSPEDLVTVAANLFAAAGFAATTIDDIVAESGVSRATVYRHIGSKEQLVAMVLGGELTALVESLRDAALNATSPNDLIWRMVHAALSTVQERPVLQRAIGEDLREVLPAATIDSAPIITAMLDGVRAILADNAGNLIPDNSDDLLEDLIRYLVAFYTTPLLTADGRDPDIGAARARDLFGPALAARLAELGPYEA